MGTSERVGAITESDRLYTEEWENVSPAVNFIIRLDARGDERYEQIGEGKQFKVTTEERILTSDRIVDKKHDPFKNGCFRPVTVPDSVDIESNPNALSEDDIDRILRSSPVAWEEYLKVVDSPATLRRFLDRFEALVAGGEDLSARRLRELETKMAEVEPKRQVTQRDRDQYENLSPGKPSMRG